MMKSNWPLKVFRRNGVKTAQYWKIAKAGLSFDSAKCGTKLRSILDKLASGHLDRWEMVAVTHSLKEGQLAVPTHSCYRNSTLLYANCCVFPGTGGAPVVVSLQVCPPVCMVYLSQVAHDVVVENRNRIGCDKRRSDSRGYDQVAHMCVSCMQYSGLICCLRICSECESVLQQIPKATGVPFATQNSEARQRYVMKCSTKFGCFSSVQGLPSIQSKMTIVVCILGMLSGLGMVRAVEKDEAGVRSLIVLSGPSGCGKTYTLRELSAQIDVIHLDYSGKVVDRRRTVVPGWVTMCLGCWRRFEVPRTSMQLWNRASTVSPQSCSCTKLCGTRGVWIPVVFQVHPHLRSLLCYTRLVSNPRLQRVAKEALTAARAINLTHYPRMTW
jgi:hypothetical protein